MRCLHCHIDVAGDVCPRCNVYLPSLLLDVLPEGTHLHNNAYRIDNVLGRGGFGITYQATHLALQDQVAIKELYPAQYATRDEITGSLLIPSDRQEGFVRELQQFKEEGRCLKDLRHSGIVRVRDMFNERGTVYLVMEFIQGRTLRAELDDQGGTGLPQEQVKKIVEQMVAALETIHHENIYHLDIKPENVLLSAPGKVILIDFGAARRKMNSSMHRQFDLNYAAPELFTHQDVGPESDLYELGMLVHELLTGKQPSSALERLAEQKPVSLSPDLVDPWRNLLERALLLQKELRPKSVRTWWESRWDNLPAVKLPAIPRPVVPLSGSDSPLKLASASPPFIPADTPIHSPFPPPVVSIADEGVTPLPVRTMRPSPIPLPTSVVAGGMRPQPIPVVISSSIDPVFVKKEPEQLLKKKAMIAFIFLGISILVLIGIILALVYH